MSLSRALQTSVGQSNGFVRRFWPLNIENGATPEARGTSMISTSQGKTEISRRLGALEVYQEQSIELPLIADLGRSRSWARHPFAGCPILPPKRFWFWLRREGAKKGDSLN